MFKESIEEQDVGNNKVRVCDTAESRAHSLRATDKEAAGFSSVRLVNLTSGCCPLEFLNPISIMAANKYFLIHEVTLSSPSSALSFVETVPQDEQISHITAFKLEDGNPKSDNESTSSRTIRDVHISTGLMEDFLELAIENTEKDLETCGILGAFLEKGTLYMTTLIIPKQESTSNSTHPSQNCFMSSVDLHTQYSYQVMIPEAFAIVLAPKDASRSCGLFRLSDPDGMNILKDCQEKGFHPHKEPDNGNPMYEHCSNVYKNSNLRFEIFDLR